MKKLFSLFALFVALAAGESFVEISCAELCINRCACAGPGGAALPPAETTMCEYNCMLTCVPWYI